LERCPECQYELHGESLDYTREVIEIPPPQAVEVIEHQVVKRWCPCCGAWRSPQLDLKGQVFGQGRIGVRIASLVAYLRTTLRLPVRQIQAYLQSQHQLTLSLGEIVELTHTVRRALQPEMNTLQQEVQASAIVHGDETGWRENGQNGYVWAFLGVSPLPVHYFVYQPTRAGRIPQGVLGLHFRGHLVSDFYGGYNVIRGPHQRCWVHMLRDLHKLKEAHAETAEVLAWVKSVGDLYTEGKTWLASHPTPTHAACQTKYADLLARILTLGEEYALTAHPCRVLAKRILRHQDELFQFVLYPGVPSDNNAAERGLRPLVIMRKISGGTRSDEGSKTRLTLYSLFSTWHARNLNPFLHCFSLLQSANAPP
jgi:transposase